MDNSVSNFRSFGNYDYYILKKFVPNVLKPCDIEEERGIIYNHTSHYQNQLFLDYSRSDKIGISGHLDDIFNMELDDIISGVLEKSNEEEMPQHLYQNYIFNSSPGKIEEFRVIM